jgi:hypothetical protein
MLLPMPHGAPLLLGWGDRGVVGTDDAPRSLPFQLSDWN